MARVQTLYYHAHVTTMDPRHPVASALLVEGGLISRVLDDLPTGLGRDVQRIDCQGAAIIPGLFDCHMHLTDTGLLAGDHNLSDCRSVDEILRRIKSFGESAIYAGNYEEYRLAENRPPTLKELDSVANDRPVLLARIDGHSCVVNSATLALAQGEVLDGIERDETNSPTGRLSGPANYRLQETFWKRLSREELRDADRRGVQMALAAGITTIHNVITGDAPFEELEEEYRANAALPLNAIPKSCTTDVAKIKKLGARIFGGDIFVDGSIGSRTAAVNYPYRDGHGSGLLYRTRDELIELFDSAYVAGVSPGVHVIGDRAIEEAIAAWEAVIAKRGPLAAARLRPSLDHFEIATADQIRRAAKLGLLLSMQPGFDYLWGGADGIYAQRLGKERAATMNAFRTALREGAIVCGGSDSPVTKLSGLLGIHSMVKHRNPDQRLTLNEALRAYTTNAARLSFDENRRGKLAAGMAADFTALERPLDDIPPDQIKDARVMMTVVAGEIRYNQM